MSKGHPHASLMLLYAQDAAETDKPWERWEIKRDPDSSWEPCVLNPVWLCNCEYRRKPKTIKVNGFDVPEPLKEADENQKVWLANPVNLSYVVDFIFNHDLPWMTTALSRGLLHRTKAAAVAHAKAMIGIDPEGVL